MVIGWLFFDTVGQRKKNLAVESQISLSGSEEISQESKVITCLRDSVKLQRTGKKGEFLQVCTKKSGGTRIEGVNEGQ